MDTNNKTERQNDRLTPFSYEDHAVRTALVNGEPWFVAKDVCDILEIQNSRDTLAKLLPENEKGVDTIYTPGGKQEMLTVNEPGLYRLIFQSRKPEAERFKTWVFGEVLPQIRRTGAYTGGGTPPRAAAGHVYSLFSGCLDMTVQRVNKLAYYLAVQPPLANTDIARLLDVSDSTVTYWRRRLSPEAARKAVAEMGIDARGHSANAPSRARPELPAKEAAE
jgi:prophage antirepressor-like protein